MVVTLQLKNAIKNFVFMFVTKLADVTAHVSQKAFTNKTEILKKFFSRALFKAPQFPQINPSSFLSASVCAVKRLAS